MGVEVDKVQVRRCLVDGTTKWVDGKFLTKEIVSHNNSSFVETSELIRERKRNITL